MAIEVIKITEEDISVTLTDVGIRGRAGLVFRGDYDNAVQYYQGDAVRFSNNLYIATGTPAVGTDPTDSLGDANEGWELLVFGSPDQTAIVDFHVQTFSGSIVFSEGDLIKGLDSKYYWALGSGTLENSTNLDNESEFELRGNPINIVGNGDISSRPASGDEIGDFWVTTDGESSIWDGTQWLDVHTKVVTTTTDGLMTSADKVKLDGIENLAEANDKVDVEFLGQVITVTSTEDGARTSDTATIPLATGSVEGLIKVDTTTLSINGGEISADETLELGKLSDVTAPTVGEDGFVLRGQNTGSGVTYNWVDNLKDTETIQTWDTTGNTNYNDNSGTVGSSIVEFEDRLYIANADIDYETNGSCSIAGINNRTQCTDNANNGTWTVTLPSEDSNWNEIGPSLLDNLDDVDTSVTEGTWSNTDSPILARVGNEWRLFPGLDDLTNIGNVPTPASDEVGYVLRTDGSGSFSWANQVARIQDFSTTDTYVAGDLVRSQNKLWLAVSLNNITPSSVLPIDGTEWQAVGPESLAELQDTSFSTPQQGNILTFDNGAWRNLTANASVAAAITLQEIGDVPANSSPNKVLVSTDAVNTESFDISLTYNQEEVVFFSGNYYRYIGTDGATLTQTPDLDTTNWSLTNGDKYAWRDYARDVKNVQAYSNTEDYEDGDLVQSGDNLFIKINGDATAPVAAPTGLENDAVWKQIGTAELDSLSDVDVSSATVELDWDGDDTSVLAFNTATGKWQKYAGLEDLRNIGNVETTPSDGEVLGYEASTDSFKWVSEVASAAKILTFSNRNAYTVGTLVTHTATGASHPTIFLNIVATTEKTSSPFNANPEDDQTSWEVVGPESISGLEDVTITSASTNDLLQFNGTDWVDQTPAQVAGTIDLSDINRVSAPSSTTDNNHVLQVTFSGTTPSYAWVDRTTNTTTIQGFSSTTTYTPGEVVEFNTAIYVAIDDNDSATTNQNQTPGATNSAFWQLIGPETFEHLEDSAISSPNTDQFIIFNGTSWINTDLVTETEKLVDLFNLKDVDGTPATNEVLRFDGTNWVPVSSSDIAKTMVLGDLLDVGVSANVSTGDFLQKDSAGNYEGVDASEVGDQIDLEGLKNVPDSFADKQLVQKGSGDDFVASTPNEIAADIDLASIKGIATPITDFVLKSDGNDTYSWVSNVLETATIQTWGATNTYAAGDLVRHLSAGGDFEIFIARANAGTNLNQIPSVTGSAFWELLGPESIDELNGITINNGTSGDLLQRTGVDAWANITPAAMAEAGIAFTDLSDIDDTSITTGDILFRDGNNWQFVSLSTVSNDSTRGIDLHDLKDVNETAESANGNVLQRTSTGWKYTTLATAVADQTTGIGIADLNDVSAPTTSETGFVLRGNNDGSSISYDWVHNEDATANIQTYNSSLNYTAGDLVIQGNAIYLAVATNGPAHSNVTTPSNTSDTVWDLVGPETLDELNDVVLTGAVAKDLIRRNAGNDGWENVKPGVLAADIRIRDLKGVPAVFTPSGILQRDNTGFSNDWTIANPATIATGDSTAGSGIKVENLKDVSTTTGTDNQLLQVDGSTYTPTDVDDVLGDGTLESIGNVSDALELNPSTTGNDLGKVLTVRSVTDSNNNVTPSFVWEANSSSSVPGFNTGSASNPQTYISGSLVTFNSQIWISLASLNSGTETNNTLPSPGTRNLPEAQGGGPEWELIGPETLAEINDTIITSPITGNIIRYDETDSKWKNVTPASVAGDTGTNQGIEITDLRDVDSAAVTDGDFLKRVSGEWTHPATLGDLNVVIDDVQLDGNISEHDILRRNSSGDWVNVKLEDHIENNVDIPLNHISDVDTSGETAGQVLEFTSSGWIPKFRGFDDITPGDESGSTVTLNRFDGKPIRSIETTNGVQTITFADDAITSATLELAPESFEWDLQSVSMDAKVSVINDILFQDVFLNTINRIRQITGSSTSNLFNAGYTETTTFLENWDHTLTVAPVDPRIGGFPTVSETSTISATVSDQNGGSQTEITQQVEWLEPILTTSTDSAATSSRFLTPLRANHTVTATVGNTNDAVNNTSLTSLEVDGQDRTTTSGTTGPTASSPTYNRTVSAIALYKQSADGASAVNTDSFSAEFQVLFTKPGTTPAQTETLTRTATVNYTATFPVLTGFLDQGVSMTSALGRDLSPTDVNDDGTGFRREFTSTNSTGKDQTLWFGIRKAAVDGSTLSFAAHNPGANPLVISNIIDGSDHLLATTETVPGYIGETYEFYGIPLVADGDTVIITIS